MAYKRISPIPVTEGGVGAQSFTAYSVICAGTTSTGAFQNVSGVGTSGQVLTSAGGGLLPTWSTLATSITTIAGTTGTATGSTVTFTGSTSGAIFTASGSTVTQSFNFLALPDTNSGATVGYISFNGTRFISDFGTNNTFVGKSSGNATSSGTGGNTALGASALPAITTAVENTAVGYGALLSATSSGFNTAVGTGALSLNSTGNGRNVAVGDGAGGSITTGDFNIYLGTLAGSGHTSTETGNIGIGNVGTAADANTTRIGTQGTGSGQQNQCFIAGIVGVTTSNSQMVTVNSSTGQLGVATVPTSALTWSVITANQNAAVNNGYICNKATTLVLTLPTTAAVGTLIEVTGINTATGWQIAQNASQIVHIGTSNTTTGAGGSLTSSAIRDSVKLVCVVANLEWNVISVVGNITVV